MNFHQWYVEAEGFLPGGGMLAAVKLDFNTGI